MLEPLRSSIYAFKTDFVVAGWIARLEPGELEAARDELAKAGFSNPTIRSFDDQPLDAKSIDQPVDVTMDVEPRNAETMAFAGRSVDQHPILGPMLAQSMASGKPLASDPFPLLRPNGPIGLVLAAPVLQEGGPPAGFVTFSYDLASLMLVNDDLSLFSVALKDPRHANSELIANDRGVVHQGRGPGCSRAVDDENGQLWQPRLVAGLLSQNQCRTPRRADGGDRGRHRPRADRDRLRAVRICRLQQPAAQP